jgi:hypothetical protein
VFLQEVKRVLEGFVAAHKIGPSRTTVFSAIFWICVLLLETASEG